MEMALKRKNGSDHEIRGSVKPFSVNLNVLWQKLIRVL
jgi:hypothetical protein